MLSTSSIRSVWANKTINYSLLILVTLLGVVIPCGYWLQYQLITPLILGVIAAALAETDDNFWGRIKALLLTFACFALATLSIQLLYPYPPLFAAGLFCSTFGFIMLGAIGPRYSSIAFGSLLIAIYTMMGVTQTQQPWLQPVLLLAGAAWYYLVSLIWQSFWPLRPVQGVLAQTFQALANYVDDKSQLFHPSQRLKPQPFRIKAAASNARTVESLELCRQTLLKRSKQGLVDGPSDRFLRIYLMVQDIHERISSSHYRYQELARDFEHSDILFRFKHLLQQYAKECRAIGRSIELGECYEKSTESTLALDEVQASMEHLLNQSRQQAPASLRQLEYLFNNLCTVDRLIHNINNPDATSEDHHLYDHTAHTPRQMWQRVADNLTLDSLLFRHAVRMACALTLGYATVQLFQLEHGFWILLTTVFVCQPNFSATKQKLLHRISGTMLGIILGVVLLTLIPEVEGQLFIIVLSGVLFFAFRLHHYAYATTFITLLALFLFAQLGTGFAVILPRLFDTLLGSLLAVAAVYFILPDWQARKMPQLMTQAISANNAYLGQIISQYRLGKNDDLAYRVARRDAHAKDAQLSSAITNMLAEPGKHQVSVDQSFRFLTLNHALLSYLSALGAHRSAINEATTHKLIIDAYQAIHANLDQIEHHLRGTELKKSSFESNQITQQLSQWRESDGSSAQMILQQLHLIHRMLPELTSLSRHFSPVIEK